MFLQRVRSLKISMVLAALLLAPVASLATPASGSLGESPRSARQVSQVEAPLNIAILIQDDLVASVGNEIRVTADFIRNLPPGSRVMVGYVTSGALQVRQGFTTDLNSAARSLRIPLGSASEFPIQFRIQLFEVRIKSHEAAYPLKERSAAGFISDAVQRALAITCSEAASTRKSY